MTKKNKQNKNNKKRTVIKETITDTLTKVEILEHVNEIHESYIKSNFTIDMIINMQYDVVSFLKEMQDNELASPGDIAYMLFRFNDYMAKIEDKLKIE